MSDEEALEKVSSLVGELKKTQQKTLEKDCFFKIFRLTGEFSKTKSKKIKQEAQNKRIEFF